MNPGGVLTRTGIEIPLSPVLRYMGCRGEVTQQVRELARDCAREVGEVARCRAAWLRVPVEHRGEEISLGALRIRSRDLERNLGYCREAFLFAATIGVETDRLISRAGLLHPARGLGCDAAGSAGVEKWCDEVNRAFAGIAAREGKYLRPRFSPGYGDLDLQFQRDFLDMVDAPRKIGVKLSQGMLLLPVKSVTAVVGIAGEEPDCLGTGCIECELPRCPYRA